MEYWRIRFDMRSENYIDYNFDMAKRIKRFPASSLNGIFQQYLYTLDPTILQRKKTLDILDYGWQTFKEDDQTLRFKSIEHQNLTYLNFVSGKTKEAIFENQKAIDTLAKSIEETSKQNAQDLPVSMKFDIYHKNILILMNITLKRVLEKQTGEVLKYDEGMLENRIWLHESAMHMFIYLETLVIRDRSDLMEAILLSELKKSGTSTLFVIKEISNLIFKIINERMGYWISPEMKQVLDTYRLKLDATLPSCEFVNLIEKKCV